MKSSLFFAPAILIAVSGHAAVVVPGHASDALLQIQSTGQQASENPQAMSGAYREKAAARFLKTLEQEVPPVELGGSFGGDES